MHRTTLTPLQQQLLDAIDAFRRTHAYPPAIRDLQEAIPVARGGKPVSTSVISYNLDQLREFGLIDRDPRRARSIVRR